VSGSENHAHHAKYHRLVGEQADLRSRRHGQPVDVCERL
jgi:hypothetical protein